MVYATTPRFYPVLEVVYTGGARSGVMLEPFDTIQDARSVADGHAAMMRAAIERGDKWWPFPRTTVFGAVGGIRLDAIAEWHWETDPLEDLQGQ